MKKSEPDYEILINTLNAKELRFLVKEYLEKGISKYKSKSDLKRGFHEILSSEQKTEAYNNFMPKKVKELVEKSLPIILFWKNAKFDLNDEQNEYSLHLNFGSFDVACSVNVNSDKKSVKHECDCNVGEAGGICLHLMALLGLLYVKEIIDFGMFPIHIQKKWLQPLVDKKNEIIGKSIIDSASPDSADIEFDEYYIFIQGNNIIMKWEGEYSGSKTVDVSEEKENTVEEWLVKKVVDMQLKSLAKYGRIRELITDKFGIIEKILNHPKQFIRLQKAFNRAETKHGKTQPKTKDEIENILSMGLLE